MDAIDHFSGCLLGLALGDALGAPYEGGVAERLAWRFMGRTRDGRMRWTDDTQMSLDLAESLMEKGGLDLDDVAARFAKSYRWSRGYGPGAASVLKAIARGVPWQSANTSIYREGSFGNGAAMRAPVIGLAYGSRVDALVECARHTARITHAHPLGMEGAVFVAAAIGRARTSAEPLDIFEFAGARCRHALFVERLDVAQAWLETARDVDPEEIRSTLGTGGSAPESCVTAVYVALRHVREPFLALQAFNRACGGDVDTIGAMSGALWGAINGASALPAPELELLEDRERIEHVARELFRASGSAAFRTVIG